ncbi:MAG: lipoprotein [Muribaculaceae bacterium]|nr:lipoprotein [Muribaculaceae bacterium]
MKQITKFFVAALAVAGLAGCSDEVEYNSYSELPHGI